MSVFRLSSHIACVMNIISYERAYCLFPRATLEYRVSLLTSRGRDGSGQSEESIDKYSKRGFCMIDHIPDDTYRRAFPVGCRWVDDSTSWVLPLDTHGVIAPPHPNSRSPPLLHDPMSTCNWEMQQTSIWGAVMHYNVTRSELLRYRYVVTETLATRLATYLFAKLQEERHKAHAEEDVWKLYVVLMLVSRPSEPVNPLPTVMMQRFLRSVASYTGWAKTIGNRVADLKEGDM